jgi:pyrroloquinoline quinone (PQQ) biosynthesis protein C
VNTSIQKIGTTAQAAQVKSVQDLANTMDKSGTTLSSLQTQVDALYKTITANAGGATTAPSNKAP